MPLRLSPAVGRRNRDSRPRGDCVPHCLATSLERSTAPGPQLPVCRPGRPSAGGGPAARPFAWLLTFSALLLALPGPLDAAPTPQQRAKATAGESLVKKAARQFAAKKLKEASDSLADAQKLLGELEADDDARQLSSTLRKSITKVHGQLSAEGVAVAPLEPAPAPAAGGGGGGSGAGKISFTQQVTPLLVSKCGRCHIEKSSGEFSMASYAQLMKGSKDGIVLFPGKGKTSRMIELIEQQDMPRGGGTVAPDELAMLTKWIDEGAKYDGKDPMARLGGGAAGALRRRKCPRSRSCKPPAKRTFCFRATLLPCCWPIAPAATATRIRAAGWT